MVASSRTGDFPYPLFTTEQARMPVLREIFFWKILLVCLALTAFINFA
jgi:hypothetical protein